MSTTPPFITPAVVETATGVSIAEAESQPEAPAASVQESVPTQSKEDVRKTLTEVYTEATKLLREHHQEHFDKLRKDLAAARGIDWTARPSKQDKAKAVARQALLDAGLDIPVELQTAADRVAQPHPHG